MKASNLFVGRELDDAMEIAQQRNREGIACSLSYLPRQKTDPKAVEHEVQQYEQALATIRDQRLDADITIKLPQLGVYSDFDLTLDAVRRITKAARDAESFVWIDMELPETVDDTLEIHRLIKQEYGNVAVCLQAYLTRTADDLEREIERGSTIRLVKGYYRKHDIARWREVTENYRRLMRRLLLGCPRPAIATHDLGLIEEAIELCDREGIETAELQFFSGVRDDKARELADQGYRVRLYLPYGPVLSYLQDGLPNFDWRRQFQRLLGLRPRP